MKKIIKKLTEKDLRYSAYSRCDCGAGLAYPKDPKYFKYLMDGHWDCSDIWLGRAIPEGEEGAVKHCGELPFAFYEIKSEDQPSANGATTRNE